MIPEKDCWLWLTFQHPERKSSSEPVKWWLERSERSDALVSIVIGSWYSYLIGSEDDEWWLVCSQGFLSCNRL